MTVPKEGESMFGRKATADYKIDPETDCWNWLKAKGRAGYPACGNGKVWHMYYRAAYGDFPKGWHIHHKCRNTQCINPEHLEAVDPRTHFIEHHLTDKGLSLEDIAEIRRLGAVPGVRAQELADQYGVSKWIINRYWRGESWGAEVGSERIECVRACEYEKCGQEFIGKRHKRYCSPACRSKSNHHKRKARHATAA